MNKNKNIHIIGAGISGLIAAKTLESYGYNPTIIEATNTVGGRVKTDIVDDYQLDHGFQVLLTAYPEAKKHLNFEALDLQYFLPGATIFNSENRKTIGDPLRKLSLLIPTLTSGIGTLKDKIKILQLNQKLKNTSIESIFEKTEKTTYNYLKDFGFSNAIIEQFFKPFFSGIFLEPNLETSSRMFEYVYKMFGEGYACLPKAGIKAIPNQLKAQLKTTKFLFNSKVEAVQNGKIILENKDSLATDYTIIATEASALISSLKNQKTDWKSCDTLYFETVSNEIKNPIIGLISDENALINNIFFHTSIETKTKGKNYLLSVTVVKSHKINQEELIKKVTDDLVSYCDITVSKFIKHYKIPKALPYLNDLKYTIEPNETHLNDTVFLAGDTQLNGSLNAAMISGEKAALGVIETITGTKL